MPLEKTVDQEQTENVKDLLMRAGVPAAARKIGRWHLFKYTESRETRKLQVLVDKNGRTGMTITKNPDGTITADTEMKDIGDVPYVQDIKAHIRNRIKEVLVREVLRLKTPGERGNALSKMMRDELAHHLEEATEQVQNLCLSEFKAPIARRRSIGSLPELENLHEWMREIVNGQMVNEDTEELAVSLFGKRGHKSQLLLKDYNTAVLSLPVLGSEKNRNLSEFYCQWITPDIDGPVKIEHAGQMVRALREKTGLNNREWKQFTKLSIKNLSGGAQTSMAQIRATCLALADMNPGKDHSKERMEEIQRWSGDHLRFSNLGEENQNHWRSWINILTKFVEDEEERDKRTSDIQRARDALNAHIQAEIPWGPGDWENLMNRTERWHRRILQEGNRKELEEARQYSWTTALQEAKVGDYTADAVTNGAELWLYGGELSNCLGTYRAKCMSGDSRIFIIRKKEVLWAGVEIIQTGQGRWKMNQIEGVNRRDPGGEATQLGNTLAELYGKEETEQAARKIAG